MTAIVELDGSGNALASLAPLHATPPAPTVDDIEPPRGAVVSGRRLGGCGLVPGRPAREALKPLSAPAIGGWSPALPGILVLLIDVVFLGLVAFVRFLFFGFYV